MSEFSHLKNKLLAEQVEDEIYHYILDTPLEPGAKLPNEFELGEKFGVGRSTVREAVKLLSSKGIVEARRGSGTYVVTTAKGLSDPLNLRSVQDKNALALDLVNVRLLLEPGMAGLYYHYQIPKYDLGKKLFGVFPHRVVRTQSPLFRGFDDIFYIPHSRYTENRLEDIQRVPELELLAISEQAGVFAVKSSDNRRFFITGHPEYDPDTLANEYFRDVNKGLDIAVPENYFAQDDPSRPPVVRWRSAAQLFYTNWLNYYVYQTTPYDLKKISD